MIRGCRHQDEIADFVPQNQSGKSQKHLNLSLLIFLCSTLIRACLHLQTGFSLSTHHQPLTETLFGLVTQSSFHVREKDDGVTSPMRLP